METLNDLLPGIEEFLITTLANENLSITAEEKRQYFVERLDILKLPPSIPPRPGRRSVHSSQNELDVVDDSVKAVPDDFAAYQRELARTFAQVPPAAKKETKTEHVKIYDDIDSSESTEEDKEHDLYEIPVVRQTEESQPNDSSSVATAASVDDITEEVADNCPPPPLPPRRDRTTSEVTNRSTESICSDKPPDLPARPPLQSRKSDNNNITDKCIKTDKTEKSDNIITDGDSTSYESYDEEEKVNDLALLNKLNIKLPKRAKKESNKLKKKISNSRSSNQLELNVPFKNLSDVVVSGELYYRGKLSWNRRLVALVNGNLVCYKPDKETRPNLAISLPGYEATYSEREGKKGFEIKLYHPNCDAHYFSVDFKEWAQTWCENINKIAQGLPAPGSHQHLARSFIGNSDQAYPSFGGSKPELNSSNSNISNASSDGLNEEAKRLKLRGNRVMRMGSFAYRATQFFENLGKKPSGKRKVDCLNKDMKTGIEEECSSSSSGLPLLTPSSDSHEPVFDDLSPLSDLKHAGYLEVFSSFNKRRWGKRYCLVRENMFECYKSEQRKTCELSFQLKTCLLRKAVAETHSEFSLMLLESGKEKITVEVGNKEEMIIWVNVLMRESANESIPEGLEEYFIDDDHSSDIQDGKEDFSDLLGYSVIKSWDLANEHYKENENSEVVQCNSTEKEESRTKDVYSKVLKTSSTENSSLVPLPGIEESAEVFDEQKLTSDSGFISVHCFNSDSESDSGCAVKSEDESRTYDGKHLHCNDQERDSTSREVTPFDSDSKEITQVGDDSTVESEQTFTDCLDQSEAPVSVRNGMNSNDVVNKKPENVLIDNKTVVNNNNVEKSLVLHLDKDISLDGDKHTDVVYKESDQTPSENSIKQNNAIKDFCLSNVASDNETTNQDLLAVKDSVQNFLEHSTELTEKSSSTSNFSISEKLENNASPAVSSEDEGDTHRYADKLSSSRMEEVSQDSLENKEKSEHNESCKNGKDKNANEEESSNDLKSKLNEASLLNSWGLDVYFETAYQHRKVPSHRQHCRGEHVHLRHNKKMSHTSHLHFVSNCSTDNNVEKCSDFNSQGTYEQEHTLNMEDLVCHCRLSELKTTLSSHSNTSIGDAADIQLRIKRLREKLVQIKRKRIAVNDKRRRVETDDEKFLCDEEYSCLEEQCRQADSEITRLVDTLSQLYQSDTISEDSTQC